MWGQQTEAGTVWVEVISELRWVVKNAVFHTIFKKWAGFWVFNTHCREREKKVNYPFCVYI